jgi:hypothetical protein
LQTGGIVALDGVHPNEIGYAVFGEYLAAEMAAIMRPIAINGAKHAWHNATEKLSSVKEDIHVVQEWLA